MRLWRYCLAGFLFNWLGFVFWSVVPIRGDAFGASSTELALLQTASTVFYVANSLFMGWLSDRVSRAALAKIASVAAIVACLLVPRAESLMFLYFVVPLMGIAGGIYWPSIQGAVGAESGPARVEKAIGWFNVSWSIGKTLGFALGAGWLVATYGHSLTMDIAAAAALPILFIYPADRVVRWEETHESTTADRAAFRTIGYVANFLAFGIGTVFSSQFIKYLGSAHLEGIGDRRAFFGVFMGSIYAAQTLAFVVLQRSRVWTYRRVLLYGTQVVCGAAAASVTFLSGSSLLAAAALVGLGLGFSNASSIYYSLHGPADHGKYAGVHEAVLGTGTVLVPLAGGILADQFHDLRMPYWLAGGATLLAIGIQEWVYYRRPSS